MSQSLTDAELVIGLVGRIGVDVKRVVNIVSECLGSLNYSTSHVKLSELARTHADAFGIVESPIEKRYETYINACNKIREISKNDHIFASYGIAKIRDERSRHSQSVDVPAPRVAYILDQIKRKEEADQLQRVYGQQFILISCHMPLDVRLATLARKISEGHYEAPRQAAWEDAARKLIDQDDEEVAVKHGQRVSKVFPLADVIVDTTLIREAKLTIERFFKALFGDFRISPTRNEYFQNIAYQTSLTSVDTSRQVGAAISRNGDLISVGYNEAPKAFGGTYWPEDGIDARDVALGRDTNTVRKRQMVLEIVNLLRPFMTEENKDDAALGEKLLTEKDGPLRSSQIMDSMEYGRAVHAEMSAITSAARQGASIAGAKLSCTTFPCHNCSKHIVASGIREVTYLEPYQKSYTSDLYPDSVEVDRSSPLNKKVCFKQFTGITPIRFGRLFSKSRMKDERGMIIDWNAKLASPNFGKIDQDHLDREVMHLRRLEETLPEEALTLFGVRPLPQDDAAGSERNTPD